MNILVLVIKGANMIQYPMKFAFIPKKNERIEAIITIPEEKRSIVHGTVYDMSGAAIADAVVRLFERIDECTKAVSHTFTDGEGEFIFGPLVADRAYLIKVYVEGVKLRELKVRPRKAKKKAKTDI